MSSDSRLKFFVADARGRRILFFIIVIIAAFALVVSMRRSFELMHILRSAAGRFGSHGGGTSNFVPRFLIKRNAEPFHYLPKPHLPAKGPVRYKPCLKIVVGILSYYKDKSKDGVLAETDFEKWLPLFDTTAKDRLGKEHHELECGLNFVFVYGRPAPEPVNKPGRIVLDMDENMNSGKSLQWFSEAAQHLFPDADYIYKMDTDIAFCPPVVLKELSAAAAVGAHYVGFPMDFESCGFNATHCPPQQRTSPDLRSDWYYMAGGFYGLRADVARNIATSEWARKNRVGFEDVQMGRMVYKVGVPPTHDGDVVNYPLECMMQRAWGGYLVIDPYPTCFLQHYGDGHKLKMIARQGPRCTDVDEYGDQKYTVETFMWGRLGNQMFQWAGALGISQQVGMQGTACIRDEEIMPYPNAKLGLAMRTHFAGPFKSPCSRNFMDAGRDAHQMTPKIFETGYALADPKLMQAPLRVPHMRFNPQLHLQSWRYFHPQLEKEIRSMYQLKDVRVEALAQEKIRKVTGGDSSKVVVGLHIRRGDHVKEVHYLRFPPKSYFINAVKRFEDLAGGADNTVFVVASDEIEWCESFLRSFLGADGNHHHNLVFIDEKKIVLSSETGEVLEDRWLFDFAVLMKCNHLIMTLGSFGWWAGYLTGGDVVYYKDMFDLEHFVNKGKARLEDHVLPSWIGLS